MRKLTLTFLTLLFCLTSNVVWSKTVSDDDLVQQEGLYYKKFTEVPFSGQVIAWSPGRRRETGPCEYDYSHVNEVFIIGQSRNLKSVTNFVTLPEKSNEIKQKIKVCSNFVTILLFNINDL